MTWRAISGRPEVAGHVSGGVEVDPSALPSAANGDFDIDISLVVDIDFSKKAGPTLNPEPYNLRTLNPKP